jgi:hypothetical protein
MVYFQTKKSQLIYFMAIWYILRPFGMCYEYLVHFVFIWYILSGSGVYDFYGFRYHIARKIWHPWFQPSQRRTKSRHCLPCQQGCQIFLATTYQNAKNIQNDWIKSTKWP